MPHKLKIKIAMTEKMLLLKMGHTHKKIYQHSKEHNQISQCFIHFHYLLLTCQLSWLTDFSAKRPESLYEKDSLMQLG